MALEGQLVRLADHIAYINHDIEDAMRGGVIYPMDIPLEVSRVLFRPDGLEIRGQLVRIPAEMLKEPAQHVLGLALLPLGHGIGVIGIRFPENGYK